MIDELTLAANKQSQGISQVRIAVQQIDESPTQQNAALVVENAAAAESLHQQAGQPHAEVMTQFRQEQRRLIRLISAAHLPPAAGIIFISDGQEGSAAYLSSDHVSCIPPCFSASAFNTGSALTASTSVA